MPGEHCSRTRGPTTTDFPHPSSSGKRSPPPLGVQISRCCKGLLQWQQTQGQHSFSPGTYPVTRVWESSRPPPANLGSLTWPRGPEPRQVRTSTPRGPTYITGNNPCQCPTTRGSTSNTPLTRGSLGSAHPLLPRACPPHPRSHARHGGGSLETHHRPCGRDSGGPPHYCVRNG